MSRAVGRSRPPPSRADCLLWALLAVFLLLEVALLSIAFLPGHDDSAAQEQRLQLLSTVPLPLPLPLAAAAADRQVEQAPSGRPGRKTEGDGPDPLAVSQPATVGGTTQPPGDELDASVTTAASGHDEDAEDGEDRDTATAPTPTAIPAPLSAGRRRRRWLLP